jgi:hypothetical protein
MSAVIEPTANSQPTRFLVPAAVKDKTNPKHKGKQHH